MMTCEELGRSEWVQEDHSLGTEKVREHKLSVYVKVWSFASISAAEGYGP